MIAKGKCPSCQKIVGKVGLEGVEISQTGGVVWKGVSYICPNCSTVLGVQIDPVALKTDIVKEILKKMGRG